MSEEYAIQMKGITKVYPNGTVANQDVNFNVRKGEIHALMGENGAGKSTFIKVITGVHHAEEGEMYVNGEETSHYLEKDWEIYRRKNIGNIYQNFNLINCK